MREAHSSTDIRDPTSDQLPAPSMDGISENIGSCVDITEHKQGEEHFRLVVESAPNAMVMVNHEGNCRFCARKSKASQKAKGKSGKCGGRERDAQPAVVARRAETLLTRRCDSPYARSASTPESSRSTLDSRNVGTGLPGAPLVTSKIPNWWKPYLSFGGNPIYLSSTK